MQTATAPRRRSAFRHYKQRFDPDAEFVWRKGVRIGEGEGAAVRAGDRVDKASLRPGMLRRFWRCQLIELADWVPPTKRSDRPPAPHAAATLFDRGGGWFDLEIAGQATERIRGRAALEARVAELELDLDALLADQARGIPTTVQPRGGGVEPVKGSESAQDGAEAAEASEVEESTEPVGDGEGGNVTGGGEDEPESAGEPEERETGDPPPADSPEGDGDGSDEAAEGAPEGDEDVAGEGATEDVAPTTEPAEGDDQAPSEGGARE